LWQDTQNNTLTSCNFAERHDQKRKPFKTNAIIF